jgi:hypothetical protein
LVKRWSDVHRSTPSLTLTVAACRVDSSGSPKKTNVSATLVEELGVASSSALNARLKLAVHLVVALDDGDVLQNGTWFTVYALARELQNGLQIGRLWLLLRVGSRWGVTADHIAARAQPGRPQELPVSAFRISFWGQNRRFVAKRGSRRAGSC